jgi:hypothetical protein
MLTPERQFKFNFHIRMTDDFKIAHNRVLSLSVGEKALFTGRGVIKDVLNGVSEVKQINAVVLHKGTASALMRC